jgi:hypothetical protein
VEQAAYPMKAEGPLEALLTMCPELRGNKGPLMLGVFSASGRSNMGEFSGTLTTGSARNALFGLAKKELNLTGTPIHIGNIEAIYGHAETGFPARQPQVPKKKGGCGTAGIVMFIMLAAVCSFGAWLFATASSRAFKQAEKEDTLNAYEHFVRDYNGFPYFNDFSERARNRIEFLRDEAALGQCKKK